MTIRTRRGSGVLAVLAMALFGVVFPVLAQEKNGALSSNVQSQMRALMQEKAGRTDAQKKIHSNLLFEIKRSRGESALIPSTIVTGVKVDARSMTVVDIVVPVSEDVLERLNSVGATVLDYRFGYANIRASVPLSVVEKIAAWPDVRFIHPKQEYSLGKPAPLTPLAAVSPKLLPVLKPGFHARAAAIRSRLSAALKSIQEITARNVSEGRVAHRADLARNAFGMTGAGVKVGVLSDGVTSLAAVQATGDLGPVTVLPGQAGSGDEGTAMLEIVHDLAPDATLFFATADPTITTFAQNIKDLRTAGCDIIVDDVFYFVETPFQRGQTAAVTSTTNGGIVIDAVNTVTAAGALYFSSAGNSGSLDDAESGTWEGDFSDGGDATGVLAGQGRIHIFAAPSTTFDTLTVPSGPVTFYWSDPLGGSANDYDLYVLNSAGSAIVDASTDTQDGTEDPFEAVNAPAAGSRLVVLKFAGAGRFLHLSTNRGLLAIPTAGTTQGHSAGMSTNSFSVAATPAAGAFGPPPNPVGPFPSPFTSANHVEIFSSDGPRRIFFNADSSAITPGNFSSTGGLLLAKPDFTAADGVSCAAPEFNPFYGTSAAAPHAAAIAALVKSAKAGVTNTQIVTALTSTAIDIEGIGADRDSGVGILDAFAAVQSAGPVPRAVLVAGTVTATEFPGNGNGFVEPGECARLSVPISNGNATIGATGVSSVLTTATAGVTILQGTSAYPDIPAASTGLNVTPFQFSVANTVACPLTIDFTLTVTYTGGPSPLAIPISLRIGAPVPTSSTTLDATAPTAVPGVFTTTTGLQTVRLARSGLATTCQAATSNPGTSGAGTRRYDAYTFTNCASGPVCVVVNVDQTAGPANALFSEAYTGSFNPASVTTNYLADAGLSGYSMYYEFPVASGASFVVVVNEVNSGTVGAAYKLTVDGLCLPCTTYATTACCPTITVSPGTLPTGSAGVAYPPTVVSPSGGTAPYSFTLTGLPTGMTSTPSGTSVTIGGTPAAAFSGTVTVSGTDSHGCPFSKDYVLTVTGVAPASLAVDVSGGILANNNKVFESGETVLVTPGWTNSGASPATFTGALSLFTGPAGPVYTIVDGASDYGTIGVGATGTCATSSNCYSLQVTGVRPTAHWDATVLETLSTGPSKTWTLHLGASFTDVPVGTSFYRFVETLFHKGITAGCGSNIFCPGTPVTRAQDAVFLLISEHGTGYTPPPATGVFGDVPVSSPFAPFVEQLVTEGLTVGCGGGNFCPASAVTRAQSAVFLLRAEHGPTYTPPPAVGLFSDVPVSSGFAPYVEQLVAEGVTAGCGGGRFCPGDPVTRGQNAVFLTTTFKLNLYGP